MRFRRRERAPDDAEARASPDSVIPFKAEDDASPRVADRRLVEFVRKRLGPRPAQQTVEDFVALFGGAGDKASPHADRLRKIGDYLDGGFVRGVDPHPLFSAGYYFEQRPDLKQAGVEPLTHYLEFGARDGLNPHPSFSTIRYLARHRDVAVAGSNPWLHFLRFGRGEGRAAPAIPRGHEHPVQAAAMLALGRDAHAGELAGPAAEPLAALRSFLLSFESERLCAEAMATRDLPRLRYAPPPSGATLDFLVDVGIAGEDELAELAAASWRELLALTFASEALFADEPAMAPARRRLTLAAEALAPEPASWATVESYETALAFFARHHGYFDEEFYRAQGVANGWRGDLFDHYVKVGARRGVAPNAYFDPAHYRRRVGRPIPDHRADLVDYCLLGWTEGADPSARFRVGDYLEACPDVAAHFAEPLSHYLKIGCREGRSAGVRPPVPSAAESRGAAPFVGPQFAKLIGQVRDRPKPRRAPDPARLRIDFVIPDFAPGAGGHMAIFKLVYWLEARGHELHVWIDYPNGRSSREETYEAIVRHFRSIKSKVHLLSERDRVETDVLFVTDRWTVWSGLKSFNALATFYLVQDLEAMFVGMGAEALVANATYDLGLTCVCSSPWLSGKMRRRGARTLDFIYPAEPAAFHPPRAVRGKPEEGPLIALYARRFTSRRAVELAVLGLTELARRGFRFTAALFGDRFDENEPWPFPVEFHHVLSEDKLGELFRRADLGMVFSATNYSIAAVEMMACGLPVIDIATESAKATYPKGAVALAPPDPAGIADTVEALWRDDEGRAARASKGRRWAAANSWPEIAGRIEAAMRAELGPYAAPAAPNTIGRARKATVAIPTFNAGPQFAAVLDATLGQRCLYEFDVLCVDSGSTDETLEVIGARPAVRLHQIPNAEFNHGGTRNRAIELSDADYVAFLTQDALPASDTWLFDLVGVLDAAPAAGGAFGRHRAYPGASPFLKRDIDQHFDLFRNEKLIVNRHTERARFEAKDPLWESFLRYFSDNNSCVSKRVWRHVPLPTIDFGEDQVWAWRMISEGFSKVYVDSAAVYHSHDRDVDETRRRARTEAAFYRIEFGVDLGVTSERDVEAQTRQMNGRDLAFAARERIPWPDLERQMRLNAAKMEGYLLAAGDATVVY